MESNLQGEYARFVRAVKEISQERTLIILIAICCIITVDNHFRTSRAIDASNQASATAEVWKTMYSETERECRLAQMEIDAFKILLAKAGLDVDHPGEKP